MTEMTPEKLQNATPENLKKLARLIKMGQPLQSLAASEAIELCVAVWEADREQLRLAIIDQANTETELNEANARKGALKKALRWYAVTNGWDQAKHKTFEGKPVASYTVARAALKEET